MKYDLKNFSKCWHDWLPPQDCQTYVSITIAKFKYWIENISSQEMYLEIKSILFT